MLHRELESCVGILKSRLPMSDPKTCWVGRLEPIQETHRGPEALKAVVRQMLNPEAGNRMPLTSPRPQDRKPEICRKNIGWDTSGFNRLLTGVT